MSSVDSTLNSASTLVVHDFVQPRNPDMPDKKLLTYGRISTFAFMAIAAIWAPIIESFSGLWSYLQSMFAIIVPPIVTILLMGLFYKRGNGDGAFWTLIIGVGAGVLLFALGRGDDPLWPVHYSYNVGICIVLSVIVFMAISAMTPAPEPAKIEGYVYERGLISAETEGLPLWKDYRFHCVILMVITAAHYIILR